MFIACAIISALLAVMLSISAAGKLTRNPKVVDALTAVGVTDPQFPVLAGLELAAAVGVVIGLWVAPLGIAAATGAVLYFVGAVIAHLRVGDTKGMAGPIVPLLMSIAALVLRVATV